MYRVCQRMCIVYTWGYNPYTAVLFCDRKTAYLVTVSRTLFYCGQNCTPRLLHGWFHRTADLGSCTGSFRSTQKLEGKVTVKLNASAVERPLSQNCLPRQFYGQFSAHPENVSMKLLTQAVLWSLFGPRFWVDRKLAVQLPRSAVLWNRPYNSQGV